MQVQSVQSPEPYVALPLRSHTILGVCEAIGEDLGFNPIFLRIPLAASVIWNPLFAFGIYFALGAVVLASRVLFPQPKNAPAPQRIAGHAENDTTGEDRLAA